MRAVLLSLAMIASTQATLAQDLKLISWNVESGGNDPSTIARELRELPRHDIYCLQEVSAKNIGRYAYAIRNEHGNSYRFIASHTGKGDRLMIVFDTDRLRLQSANEMFRFGDYELNDWNHRSPLALQLKDAYTGKRFYVVTVHLARGDDSLRKDQASGLREWAKALSDPALLLGDCNFDYSYADNDGNASYDAFVAPGTPWTWVRPAVDVDTNWSDRDGDGQDNYPNSCLDFCFSAGSGLGAIEAEVLVRPGDFPDGEDRSDHRPVVVTVTP